MVDFTVFKGSKEGKIVKATTTREVGPNDVLVKITHSVRNAPSPSHRHAIPNATIHHSQNCSHMQQSNHNC